MSVRKDKVALLVSELKGYDYVAAGNKVIVYFNSFDVECGNFSRGCLNWGYQIQK